MAEEAKKKSDAAPPAAGGHGDKSAPAGGDHKAEAKSGGGGMLSRMPVLIGGVMIIEAAVLFAGFKFLGAAPKSAAAALINEDGTPASDGEGAASTEGAKKEGSGEGGGHGAAADSKAEKIPPKKAIEIPVVIDFKAPNKLSGRSIIYDVAITAATKGMYKDKVEKTFREREGLLKDRIRTIIAECETDKLAEPGLETLRRRVKYQLDLILGDGVIDEVLVPRCIPFRSDY
jgi:flagellar basal body-associated protein FliL